LRKPYADNSKRDSIAGMTMTSQHTVGCKIRRFTGWLYWLLEHYEHCVKTSAYINYVPDVPVIL